MHKRAKHASAASTAFIICTITTALAVVIGAFILIRRAVDTRRLTIQQERLNRVKVSATMPPAEPTWAVVLTDETAEAAQTTEPVPTAPPEYELLPEYQALYAENSDLIGWLTVDGTVIDYPVMQTPEDEEYYLDRGFDRAHNTNGCLIMDTDSEVGVGTAEFDYENGIPPSANLIIHGHTMKSGAMFGDLQLYADAAYGAAHNAIRFDSLYEHRSYELIAVFYTQVFYEDEDVFKYYKFFRADTQEEFDDWYNNIKALSLYDTGITAELGDEFITLSCCSYQAEDGRFVVVGKRAQ